MLQNTNYNKERYQIGVVDTCYCFLSLYYRDVVLGKEAVSKQAELLSVTLYL